MNLYKAAREEYEKADAVSSEKHAEAEKLKNKLIELMYTAGKTSYIVEGVALISISSKSQVTTPKTIEDKQKFFDWIESKYGKEGLLSYQTINFQSLNSLYNAELKEAIDKGLDFNVPGIELPTVVRTLSMRAK